MIKLEDDLPTVKCARSTQTCAVCRPKARQVAKWSPNSRPRRRKRAEWLTL